MGGEQAAAKIYINGAKIQSFSKITPNKHPSFW